MGVVVLWGVCVIVYIVVVVILRGGVGVCFVLLLGFFIVCDGVVFLGFLGCLFVVNYIY